MVLSENESRAFGEFERSGWNKAADLYHQHFGALTQQSSNALLDAACVQSGSNVLDVATGPGYVAASAQQRGANVIGIDLSQAQVDLARRNYPGIDFSRAAPSIWPSNPPYSTPLSWGSVSSICRTPSVASPKRFEFSSQAAISPRPSGQT